MDELLPRPHGLSVCSRVPLYLPACTVPFVVVLLEQLAQPAEACLTGLFSLVYTNSYQGA